MISLERSLCLISSLFIPTIVWSTSTQLASIQLSVSQDLKPCNHKLQQCSISVSQSPCASGLIKITNTSSTAIQSLKASSTNPNFINYVVQTNNCPALLQPGKTCTITFATNAPVTFSILNVAISGTNTKPSYFNMQAVPCLSLGQQYGGGRVACLNGGSTGNLIAADFATYPYGDVSSNPAPATSWGPNGTTGATDYNNGAANTAIWAGLGGYPAASFCSDYTVTDSQGNTYDDWFVPAANQLYCLYTNRNVPGLVSLFSPLGYWSSTESGILNVQYVDFDSGTQNAVPRWAPVYYTCVRSAT